MAALDNNDQNSSWFCSFWFLESSFCSWDKRGKEFYRWYFYQRIPSFKMTVQPNMNAVSALPRTIVSWVMKSIEILIIFFSLQWIAFLPSIFSCSLGTILFKQKKKTTLSSLCPRRFSGGWLEVTIVSYQNLVICLTNLTEFVNRSKYRLLSHKSIVFHLHWTEYNIVCHLLSF